MPTHFMTKRRIEAECAVDPTTQCWMWQGQKMPSGYGVVAAISDNGKRTLIAAHRVAYELFVGPLTKDLEVHHVCGRRLCCNPEHLQALTDLEHKRADPNWVGNRTHCIRGHPLSGDNVRLVRGARRCRQCDALRMRQYRAADPGQTAKNTEAMRQWREKNRDKWNDYQREYRRRKRREQNGS